jgi:hypothetical protein
MSEHPFELPKKTAGDHAHLAARAIFSAIPYVGGPAVEIFNSFVSPPLQRRTTEWMESVGLAIERLSLTETNVVKRLQNDQQFQSVLLHASWAAVRNHQHEKLSALRNAVLNAAQRLDVAEDLQLLFVRYVDELTPTHIFVMNFFVEHEKIVAHLESYPKLATAFCETSKKQIDSTFFKLVCEDLKQRGLVRISQDMEDFPGVYDVDRLVTEDTSPHPRLLVTNVGRSFIDFVLSNPLEVLR